MTSKSENKNEGIAFLTFHTNCFWTFIRCFQTIIELFVIVTCSLDIKAFYSWWDC